MKHSLTKAVVAAVLVAFLASAAPLPAATAAQARQIGVADYKAVLENCNAYGQMLTQLNGEMEAAKIALGKQLMAEQNPVRRRQLTVQFEDNYAKRKKELTRPLFEQVKAAVVQVAQEYGLSKVEDTATGARGVDITRAVIGLLNSSVPAPQQQPGQPAPAPQQYAQAPAPQQTALSAEPDPFATPQQSGTIERKARKAQAKADKAAKKAAKLAAKAKAAEERAQTLAQNAPETQSTAQPADMQSAKVTAAAASESSSSASPSTAEDAAIAKASANIDSMIADLNRPKQETPKKVLYTGNTATGSAPAQRTFAPAGSGRHYIGASIDVPSLDMTVEEEQEAPAPKAARKPATKQKNQYSVKAVRPQRTLDVADVPAKAEPNSAAEAAGRQRRATRATRNVKASPAEYRGKAKGNLEVQFGADYDKPDITRMVNLAKKNGISNAYVLETTSQRTGKLFWRARVPAANRAEAQALSRKLSAIGLSNYITDGR